MIVDTSAIVAIWQREPGWEAIDYLLKDDPSPTMSAATLVELYAVLDSRDSPENQRRLDTLLTGYGIVIVPFDHEQALIARAAYRDFGKGSGHRAHLNLGDCFSYALASAKHQPLIHVGDDFKYTDLPSI
ncbi:MAG: type II toxin-antitoxin system VapC family toxin [Propionibacteriaceae bacterium]|nr:type II toxin-antitoxin system VapC family toxin [Propionibacteriaceae bacterium]